MPEFLSKQRWYPAKDARAPPQVTVNKLVPFAAPGVAAAIVAWQVKYYGREALNLFVPLAIVPIAEADRSHLLTEAPMELAGIDRAAIIDAFSQDAFVRAWVNLHLGVGESVALRTLQVGQTESLGSAGLEDAGDWRIRRGTAEQSNTSIHIGERAILKVFRKLEVGVHPELEVGRFLTRAGFSATPATLGWIATDDGPTSSTLSVLQQFVPNQGDGWSWTLERLRCALNNEEQQPFIQTVEWLRSLARRTAELHRTFAADTEVAAFRPEPVEATDLESWSSASVTQAEHILKELEASSGQGEPQSLRLASELRSRSRLLKQALQSLTEAPPAFTKTRHHGDFHLGQTLVVDNDAVIIDFEGEPLRPLAERRAKHCVLRDVAGMLRSFSYAVAAAARAVPRDLAADGQRAARVRLANWHARACTVFLDSYFATAQGISSLPAARKHAERLLRFFLLEKALYEIAYERANRPDWLEIPLRGVLDVLDLDATET
jgi:trehalose synthase-fused probable maltokinase